MEALPDLFKIAILSNRVRLQSNSEQNAVDFDVFYFLLILVAFDSLKG